MLRRFGFSSRSDLSCSFQLSNLSRSSLGLWSFLKMLGLEPGTTRPSMLSECAYHLRYIPVDPSAHTHSLSGQGLANPPWERQSRQKSLFFIFWPKIFCEFYRTKQFFGDWTSFKGLLLCSYWAQKFLNGTFLFAEIIYDSNIFSFRFSQNFVWQWSAREHTLIVFRFSHLNFQI